MMLWRSLRPKEIAAALLALEGVLRKRSRADWAARGRHAVADADRRRVDEAIAEIKERV